MRQIRSTSHCMSQNCLRLVKGLRFLKHPNGKPHRQEYGQSTKGCLPKLVRENAMIADPTERQCSQYVEYAHCPIKRPATLAQSKRFHGQSLYNFNSACSVAILNSAVAMIACESAASTAKSALACKLSATVSPKMADPTKN